MLRKLRILGVLLAAACLMGATACKSTDTAGAKDRANVNGSFDDPGGPLDPSRAEEDKDKDINP